MSHFVFIESNTTGTGRLAVERLLAQDHGVTFLANRLDRYPFLSSSRPGLNCTEVNTNDTQVVHREVLGIHARHPIDAIVTFSEFYVETVAQIAHHLSLRFLSPAAAARCRNKHQTRLALRQAGLPTPEFHLVTSASEALEISERINYPCIVKPPADSSSTGVRQVANPTELLAQVRKVAAWESNIRGQRLDGQVLVESLLDGPEHSVETFTLADGTTQVIGVTDKYLSTPPYFVELGHDFPSRGEEATCRRLTEAALAALKAVEFDLGPAHVEIRDTSGGPVVVEINPRLAGGMIPELIFHALGIDLLAAWFDLLLDRPIDLQPIRHGRASIRFLTAPQTGTLQSITGVAKARSVPTVREVVVTATPGATLTTAIDTYGRLGHVLAASRDETQRDAVHTAADRALAHIRLEVAPHHGEDVAKP